MPIGVDLDFVGGPLDVNANVALSLPTIHLAIDDPLPGIHLFIDRIPKIELGIIDPIEIKLTRIPDVRMHLPADFCVGLSVLGMELLNLRLCGEAQVITEEYRPNPCEVCGPMDHAFLQVAELVPALEAA
jgi:hypothetical protein